MEMKKKWKKGGCYVLSTNTCGKDRIMITTNGTYLWSFVTEIFRFWWLKLNHSELQYKTGICKSLLPKDYMDMWTRVRTINKGKWDELMKKSYFLCKQKGNSVPWAPVIAHTLCSPGIFIYRPVSASNGRSLNEKLSKVISV